jgi:hypothetical protein
MANLEKIREREKYLRHLREKLEKRMNIWLILIE